MSRVLGVLACAVGVLVPAWAGQVQSAPGGQHPRMGGLVDPRMPDRRARPPFVAAHARTQPRNRQRAPTAARQLVLTFDDGPELATTPLVLDELDRHGLKAAFFVAGRRLIGQSPEAKARRALLSDIAARGHLVANHTVRHKNLCDEPESIDAEIDTNQRLLTHLLGTPPRLFRSPFGARCAQLDRALANRGMVEVGWTIDPQDWRRQPPEAVAAYVRERVATMDARGVLLLHDTHSTGVRALPLILDFLADERARADRGEARPLEVVSPALLAPGLEELPTGLEPIAKELAAAFNELSANLGDR